CPTCPPALPAHPALKLRDTFPIKMNRRTFLEQTTRGAALLAAGATSPGLADAPATPGDGFELAEVGIDALQAGLRSGRWTSARLVALYSERIRSLDRQGPSLRAVMELNPEAAGAAAQLDAERKAKGPRSRLHGIPILLKDNIDTADRMKTSAGSLALASS